MVLLRGRIATASVLGALVASLATNALALPPEGDAKKEVAAKKAKKKAPAAKKAAETKAPEAAVAPAPSVAPAPAPVPPPAAASNALPAVDPSSPEVRRIDAYGDQAKAKTVSAPVPVVAPPPPPAAAAPPAATVVELAPEKRSSGIGLGVSLKLALMVPAGRAANATAAADTVAQASRGAFGAGALQLRYGLPFLKRALSIEVESGFYQLAGEGTRSFANDPDYGPELTYHWETKTVPVLAGLSFRLPIPIPIPLAFTPEAGFAAVWVRSQATYTSGGTQVTDAPQIGWALGFYLGLEATFDIGLGSILAEVKYTNARTDLGFQQTYPDSPYNATPGDVEGTHLALGYRFSF